MLMYPKPCGVMSSVVSHNVNEIAWRPSASRHEKVDAAVQ